MTLMTLGNASLWVTIPGVRFDAWSIVMGNLELAAYILSWAGLVLAVVQIMVLGIDKTTSSTRLREVPRHSLDNEQQASETEMDNNRASMYEKSREVSSRKIIRLIRLLPLTDGERIRCEIVNRDLDKASGDYEAVSYTWGDMKEQAVIDIDGRPIRISRKVSEMLRVLRYTWKARMLWIDNICINQVDIN
ncbi:hypothetical protein F5Y09DRAFT_337568 [Xylaria sp. FL1042]|nr:hypothetical protein F5Y09DRAFT_337568 [Xylaria sp. FL1042]